LPSGMIMKGIGGFYYVKTGEGTYECKARGIFRKEEITPFPGDRVNISIVDAAGLKGSLDEILPRDSLLVRPAVANVTRIVLVLAAKSPPPDLVLLDKLLITAEMKKLHAVICINKVDLVEAKEYEHIAAAYQKAGYSVLFLSSCTNQGFESLQEELSDGITVFAGQSGVGKSTILNRILDSWVLETGEISHRNERGKHTTRHTELVELSNGGLVVDTPGFSSFEVADLEYDELELYYPEFAPCLNQCRFPGCGHNSEPECSVKEALEAGRIDEGRYNRYLQLYTLLKENRTYKSKKSGKS
jgi:ribosome biogenesis GTPase / thiamine phosphate phosphatase